MSLLRSLLLALPACVALLPAEALACGSAPDPCAPFTVNGVEAAIPANTPRLLVAGRMGLSDADVTLYAGMAPDAPAVTGWHLLREGAWPKALVFDQPLTPGTDYRLVVASPCGAAQDIAIRADAAAPPPTALGKLEVSFVRKRDRLFDSGYRCAEVEFDALIADLNVAWSDDARPWRNLFEWEVIVDNVRQFYPVARETQLRVDCDGGYGRLLREGTHRVSLRATLPGTTSVIEAEPVETTMLCAPADKTGPEQADANASSPAVTANAAMDGSPADDDPDAASPAPGCRLSAQSNPRAPDLALIVACLLLRRRRVATPR